MTKDSVLVIGSGMMGSGIASRSALAGHKTTILGRDLSRVMACIEEAKRCIDELEANDLATPEAAAKARDLIRPSINMEEACKDAQYVIEAIVEDLEIKQDLFQQLDSLLPLEVTILTTTSGLRITDIAAKMVHPERALTAHFWFPGHLVPLVEIVVGDRSDPARAEEVKKLLLAWGKSPVIVHRDIPGQLVGLVQQAMIREAVHIVEMGLCSAEDIDTAIKMGFGVRLPVWGPLEHVDGVGLDLCQKVQNSVLPSVSNAQTAAKSFEEKIKAGDLGAKSGKGFYDWSVKDMNALAERRNRFIIEVLQFHKRNEK